MLEVFPESLDRIEAIFAQCKGARGSGGPGIHQGHLHHIELLLCIAHEGTAVGNVDVHVRPLIQVVDIIRVAATHNGVGNDWIDLDSGDARTPGS